MDIFTFIRRVAGSFVYDTINTYFNQRIYITITNKEETTDLPLCGCVNSCPLTYFLEADFSWSKKRKNGGAKYIMIKITSNELSIRKKYHMWSKLRENTFTVNHIFGKICIIRNVKYYGLRNCSNDFVHPMIVCHECIIEKKKVIYKAMRIIFPEYEGSTAPTRSEKTRSKAILLSNAIQNKWPSLLVVEKRRGGQTVITTGWSSLKMVIVGERLYIIVDETWKIHCDVLG
jgi:hypothetical protein